MGYTSLTLEGFKSSLSSGRYKDVTAARRALGKARSLSDSDLISARDYATKFFSNTKAVAQSDSPKKSAAKKPAAASAAKKVASKAASPTKAKEVAPLPKSVKKAAPSKSVASKASKKKTQAKKRKV